MGSQALNNPALGLMKTPLIGHKADLLAKCQENKVICSQIHLNQLSQIHPVDP